MSIRRPSSRIRTLEPGATLVVTRHNVNEIARAAADGRLSPEDLREVQKQLASDPALREAFEQRAGMLQMVQQTVGGMKISSDFDAKASQRHQRRQELKARLEAEGQDTTAQKLSSVGLGLPDEQEEELVGAPGGFFDSLSHSFGAAPWWMVSGAFHALLLLLLTLIGMAIMRANPNDVVIVTDLAKVQEQEYDQEKPRDIFKKPVPTEVSDMPPVDQPVVVHEEVEISDHVETENNMDMQSAHGDESAISDVPLGGVGTVAAIGLGGGGGGAFGQRLGGGRRRLATRGGGGVATESAVDAALAWLARNQEADGHWDTMKHQGKNNVDAGVTGLAALAFLGAGHTEKVGKYKDNVSRAIKWIISQQQDNGAIGANYKEHWHPGHAYHHAICGLALAEASAMGRIAETKAAAQKAVTYSTEIHQYGEGSDKLAWRYHAKTKAADTSVSGWFVMQLKSAKIAGLSVDAGSFEGALQFFDSVEIKGEVNGYSGGRFSYTKGSKETLNNTAIGLLCNLFLGRKATDLQGGAEYLSQTLPTWDKGLGKGLDGNRTFPMYYTYYSTLTMFQMGGDYWKRWNDSMKNMLLPNQRKGGAEDGSWDPLGGGDDTMAGRVYMTAMGALCLEVYYRYLPITKQ
ncbi:MAG: hypothetical protein AMXMBFR7_06510 [Planctomycetota bacterium]